jgi:hypothetical protein
VQQRDLPGQSLSRYGCEGRNPSISLAPRLVPTFRSSCYIAAATFTNFGKSWALANILILVRLSI